MAVVVTVSSLSGSDPGVISGGVNGGGGTIVWFFTIVSLTVQGPYR
jgi:hypothetical protein